MTDECASPPKKYRTTAKPVKVLKKIKTADGQTKLVRKGSPEFDAKPADLLPAQPDQRIAKHLARVGVASRREVERMIGDGRVKLNGRTLETPAVLVGPRDIIEVDGEPVAGRERTRLWLYHKPSGLVTTNADPEGRKTVFESLPDDLPRVLSVGRLDITTEGLLLLTNDGGLARQLELPSTGWLRRYRVRVHGEVDEAALDGLSKGIAVEGVLYGPIEATLDRTQGQNAWLTLGLREGKNREVRNVLGALGLEVNRLIRTSYGPFQLGELAPGEVREIRGRTLRDQLGEKLVLASGADFEAGLRSPGKPKKESDARPHRGRGYGQSRGNSGASGGDRRVGDKNKRGQARRETMNRLDTQIADVRKGPRGAKEGARDDRRFSKRDDKRDDKRDYRRDEGGRDKAGDRNGKPKELKSRGMFGKTNAGGSTRGGRDGAAGRADGPRSKGQFDRPHSTTAGSSHGSRSGERHGSPDKGPDRAPGKGLGGGKSARSEGDRNSKGGSRGGAKGGPGADRRR